MLTEGSGVPIGVAVAGANVHDQKLVQETLASIPVRRPRTKPRKKQNLCADKGYDAEAVRKAARRRRYVPHIPKKGEPASTRRRRGAKPRRWVVERTPSLINRPPPLLTRLQKNAPNYLPLIHLPFAIITPRPAELLG